MRADEQDRISLSDSTPLGGGGRSPVVDIVVLVIVFIVAAIVAFSYFSNFEADYSVLADGHGGGGSGAGGSSTSGAYGSAYDVSPGNRADLNTFDSRLTEPEPLIDEEVKLKYELPDNSPILQQSDAGLLEQLKKLTALYDIVAWSDTQDLARRFVVVIYNLAYGDVAHRYLPVKSPEKPFSAVGKGETLRINPASYARYNDYAAAFSGMDAERAVAIYRFFYPAFRSAFAELGEPRKSLHNEAIKAIDHLLDTPEIDDKILLVRPAVYYKFADPQLEILTPAQKQLLRVGAKNRALIIAKLEELKALLTASDET